MRAVSKKTGPSGQQWATPTSATCSKNTGELEDPLSVALPCTRPVLPCRQPAVRQNRAAGRTVEMQTVQMNAGASQDRRRPGLTAGCHVA
jgi:hypothetical protein